MRRRLWRSPDVVVLQLLGNGNVDALDRGHVEGRADGRAFRARPVVATDIDDEGVVELAYVLYGLDDAADLMVGIGDVGGIDFGLTREQLLLIGRERIPFRQLGAAILGLAVRPWRKRRGGRDHTEPLLVGEDLLAQFVPTHVELTLELLNPFRCGLMRRVGGAGNV